MLFMAMLLSAQDADRVEATLSTYRELTRVTSRCDDPKAEDEIVVCSRRDADRYRIPLATPPKPDAGPDRTARLTRDYGLTPCGQGAFTVNCGKVGVGVSVTFGAGAGSGATRITTDHSPPP